jgi:hypothetical protein
MPAPFSSQPIMRKRTKPSSSDRGRVIRALERSLSRTTEPKLRAQLAATIERMRAASREESR